MKTHISSAMLSYLRTRVTKTFARCWRVDTVGGQSFGYTSHTRTFTFEGLTYDPVLGFTGSALKVTEGLSPDNITVAAFLSDQDEVNIYAGVYDDARVLVFIVNYLDLSMGKIIEKSGFLGQITRSDGVFSAEIRGLAHRLQAKVGRIYGISCDTRLGDDRCKKDISGVEFSTTGVVLTVQSHSKFTVGLATGPYDNNWFTEGNIEFTSGKNIGQRRDIKSQVGQNITTFLEFPFAVEVGDEFNIEAGCTKDLNTCKQKFDNVVNFRGFPYVPTTEEVFFSPVSSGTIYGS